MARVAAKGPSGLAVVMRTDHTDEPVRLLNVAEVAARLRVTERFVRRVVAERRIAIQKVGRHVRFREDDVERFLDDGYLPPSPWGRSR
ncbi:MAG: helix-turn-helix domain-containing protein [Actinomycetota bacterium]